MLVTILQIALIAFSSLQAAITVVIVYFVRRRSGIRRWIPPDRDVEDGVLPQLPVPKRVHWEDDDDEKVDEPKQDRDR